MKVSELLNTLSNHKIVGLAESTHGQLKLNKFRSKLIKKLITNHHFRVIVLEEQYSCCKILDKYIKGNKIDVKDGLEAFPFTNTTFLYLLKWLKSYNKKNKNIISIIGIDCQYSCSKYKSTSKLNKIINNFADTYDKLPYSDNVKKSNYRDRCMYKIFLEQYNDKYKYIILGHNGHLQKEGYDSKDKIKWFGNYLNDKFKNKYCVVGNTFYNGSYLAKDIDNNYKPASANITLNNILKDGIYQVTKDIKNKIIYDGEVTFSSINPMETFYDAKLHSRFDILLVLNNEKPFKMI